MSYLQVTAIRPSLRVHFQYNKPHRFVPLNFHKALKDTLGSSKKCKELMKCYVVQRNGYQRCTPVCLFGGKGESKNDNEESPWKSMEKAMSSLKKEQSLEDVLRQQMEKQDYFGGSGGGIGGGGGGGGGDGFGGTDDDDIFDDILQVTFAIIALIVLYLYIIAADQVTVFVTDAFRFILGKKGPRLRTIMYNFARFYQGFKVKVPYDQYWLEKAIILTPTLYDSPTKYRVMLNLPIKGKRDRDSDSDNDKSYDDKSYGEDSDDDDENSYNNYGNKAYNDSNESQNADYSEEDEF